MSFSSKFNKVTHNIDTKGFKYTNLDVMFDPKKPNQVYKLDWLYVRTGKYGQHPIFINVERKEQVNIPAHMTEMVQTILSTPEAVQSIKDGAVGFTIYKYTSHNKDCYSVNFVDM